MSDWLPEDMREPEFPVFPRPRPRRRPFGRGPLVLLVLAAMAALIGLFAGRGLAYLTVGISSGSNGAAVAGSVDKVTGLALGSGGLATTANPDVPLTWDTATLADTTPVGGYLVNRYDGSNNPQRSPRTAQRDGHDH